MQPFIYVQTLLSSDTNTHGPTPTHTQSQNSSILKAVNLQNNVIKSPHSFVP